MQNDPSQRRQKHTRHFAEICWAWNHTRTTPKKTGGGTEKREGGRSSVWDAINNWASRGEIMIDTYPNSRGNATKRHRNMWDSISLQHRKRKTNSQFSSWQTDNSSSALLASRGGSWHPKCHRVSTHNDSNNRARRRRRRRRRNSNAALL